MTSDSPNMSHSDDATRRAKKMTAPLSQWVESAASDEPIPATAIEPAVTSLEQDLILVLREHEGMADELLRVYEQLAMVFDVTRNLLAFRSEREVVALFIDRLKSTFRDVVFATLRDGADETYAVTGDTEEMPEWITRAVTESKQHRRVRVVDSGIAVGFAPDGHPHVADEALIAPVFAGDDFACAIVLWRSTAAGKQNLNIRQRWQSGDMLLLDSLATFCGDAIRNFRLLQELQQMSMDMVRSLVSAVDQKDPYTSGHSGRVRYYALLLGVEVGYDKDELRTLEWSALLHDVGKIGIRDDVLKKPGRLTEDEFEHIKEHPSRGYEVVHAVPQMKDVLDGVRHHHEHYDGTGYPSGLKGKDIPLQARIIQIADVFDALTTNRSYRGAYDWRPAIEILQEEAGTVVDPELSAKFVALLERAHQRNPKAFEAIGKANERLYLTEDSDESA